MPGLFEPLRLGPVELPNRIVSTSHQTSLVHDHLPTEALVDYHRERARGGAGLIVLEATAVVEHGLLTPHTLAGFRDDVVPRWRALAEAVRPHGTALFAQLLHGGRELFASAPRPAALAPSAVPSRRIGVEPGELTEEEIEQLLAGFARSAALAAEGGLDGVEISAAHGYLPAQFFTPELNRREDGWAYGPRFLLEVLERVRAAAPGLALGVRLSADARAPREVAPLLAGGVDYLSLALGDSSTYLGSAGIVPPPPLPPDRIEECAAAFRVGPPLVLTSRVLEARQAERLLARGAADAVGMTRALIADPALPRKVREGREDAVLRCIGCNACIAHYHAGTPIACTVNPRTGREAVLPPPRAGARRLRALVAGAGPAGLAAAVELAASGHEVVVLEAQERAGGQIALAGAVPGWEEIAGSLLANLAGEVARTGTQLRTGAQAGEAVLAEIAPDLAVVATGARPYAPPLPLEGVPVLQAWDVLAGVEPPGERVLVADWGGDPTGVAVAQALAGGREVTLAVGGPGVGASLHQYRRWHALGRLHRAGVRLAPHLELAGVQDGEIVLRNAFAPELEERERPDALVLALGRVPRPDPLRAAAAAGLPVERAGDCRSPRSLEEAVLEGTLAARRAAARAQAGASTREPPAVSP